jgi:hypothetical protein
MYVTFQENGHPNPIFNKDGRSAFILQQEFRAFKNTDPEEKHQKAIPISVNSKIAKQDSTKLKWATAQLATMGIFFAMRSCKYLKVKTAEQQRTKIVRLCNICFLQVPSSSATTIPNLNTPTALPSHLSTRKRMKRWTPSPLPSQGRGSNSKKNQEISGDHLELSNLHVLQQWRH